MFSFPGWIFSLLKCPSSAIMLFQIFQHSDYHLLHLIQFVLGLLQLWLGSAFSVWLCRHRQPRRQNGTILCLRSLFLGLNVSWFYFGGLIYLKIKHECFIKDLINQRIYNNGIKLLIIFLSFSILFPSLEAIFLHIYIFIYISVCVYLYIYPYIYAFVSYKLIYIYSCHFVVFHLTIFLRLFHVRCAHIFFKWLHGIPRCGHAIIYSLTSTMYTHLGSYHFIIFTNCKLCYDEYSWQNANLSLS